MVPENQKCDRNSFSEVYLIFDYDGHTNDIFNENMHSALLETLEAFDGETENWISVIRWLKQSKIFPNIDINSICFLKVNLGKGYSNESRRN